MLRTPAKSSDRSQRVQADPLVEAKACLDRGEEKQALKHAKKAFKTDKVYCARIFLGEWYLKSKKFIDALESFLDAYDNIEDPELKRQTVFRINEVDTQFTEQNPEGNSLLHLFALKGHVTRVRQLLAIDFKPDIKNKQGQTAFHVAAASGQLEVLKSLLSIQDVYTHLRVNEQDESGRTPFDLSLQFGHATTLGYLIEWGVIATDRDTIYQYACLAIRYHQLPSLQCLIQCCPNVVRHTNEQNQTLLHQAVLNNDTDAIRWLCTETAVEMGVMDCNGKQAKDLATADEIRWVFLDLDYLAQTQLNHTRNIAIAIAQGVVTQLALRGEEAKDIEDAVIHGLLNHVETQLYLQEADGKDSEALTIHLSAALREKNFTRKQSDARLKIVGKVIEKTRHKKITTCIEDALDTWQHLSIDTDELSPSHHHPYTDLMDISDETISNDPVVRRFCSRFESQFDLLFGELRALATGDVRELKDEGHQIADLVRVVAASSQQERDVGTSIISVVLASVGLRLRERLTQRNAARMRDLFETVSPYERAQLVHDVAFYLAKKYRIQLHHINTKNSIQRLADHAVERIVEYILAKESHSLAVSTSPFTKTVFRIGSTLTKRSMPVKAEELKHLFSVFLEGFTAIHRSVKHSAKKLFSVERDSGEKYLRTLDGFDHRWVAKGVFENTGIIISTGDHYACNGCQLETYGYCFGTVEEAERRGLRRKPYWGLSNKLWPEGRQWPELVLTRLQGGAVYQRVDSEVKHDELFSLSHQERISDVEANKSEFDVFQALLEAREYGEAAIKMKRLLESEPLNQDYHYWHANVLYQQQYYQDALNVLHQNGDECDLEVLILRGKCYYEQGEVDAAIRQYNAVIRLATEQEGAERSLAFAYMMRAKIHQNFHEYVQAYSDAQEAVRYNPELSGAWLLISNEHLRHDNYLQAARDRLEAYHVFPSDSIRSSLATLNEVYIDTEKLNPNKDSLLHVLIHEHQAEADPSYIAWLAQTGIGLNHRNQDQQTPLQLAIRRGYLSVVKILVEQGASLTSHEHEEAKADDPTEDDVLKLAISSGHVSIVAYFINEKELITKDTETLYQLACDALSKQQLPVLAWLVDTYPIILGYRDGQEYTLLDKAVLENDGTAVQYLLNTGQVDTSRIDIIDDQLKDTTEQKTLVDGISSLHTHTQHREQNTINDICSAVHVKLNEAEWHSGKEEKLNERITDSIRANHRIAARLAEFSEGDIEHLASSIAAVVLTFDPKTLKTSKSNFKTALKDTLEQWQPIPLGQLLTPPSAPPEEEVMEEKSDVEEGSARSRFRQRFEEQFDQLFCEFRALAQGKVRKKGDELDDFRDVTMIHTSATTSLFKGIIAASLTDMALELRERYQKNKADCIFAQFESFSPLERVLFIRDMASILDKKYQQQLNFLDDEGVEHVADCAVLRVFNYMLKKSLFEKLSNMLDRAYRKLTMWVTGKAIPKADESRKDLCQIFLEALNKVEFSSSREERALLRTIDGSNDWTVKAIFENTGIYTEDGFLYTHGNCNPSKYGYCLGTKEEVSIRGWTRSAQQARGDEWPSSRYLMSTSADTLRQASLSRSVAYGQVLFRKSEDRQAGNSSQQEIVVEQSGSPGVTHASG